MHVPSFWTTEIVKAWLRQAAITERSFPQVKAKGYQSYWPDVIHDHIDAYGWEPAKETHCKPTAEQIDAYDYVSLWCRLVTREQAAMLWQAAHRVPHKIMMEQHHCGRTTLHQLLMRAWNEIAIKLNCGVNLDAISRNIVANMCERNSSEQISEKRVSDL